MSTPGHWTAFLGVTMTAEPRAYRLCTDAEHSSLPIANITIFHILSIYPKFSIFPKERYSNTRKSKKKFSTQIQSKRWVAG